MTVPSPALARVLLAIGLALLLLAAAVSYRPVGALVTEPPALVLPTAVVMTREAQP